MRRYPTAGVWLVRVKVILSFSRGLLYRKDKVEGQPVCQLCVPTARSDSILKLAHDSVHGGHLGERKTCQRC